MLESSLPPVAVAITLALLAVVLVVAAATVAVACTVQRTLTVHACPPSYTAGGREGHSAIDRSVYRTDRQAALSCSAPTGGRK
jgi:hypothetical protein